MGGASLCSHLPVSLQSFSISDRFHCFHSPHGTTPIVDDVTVMSSEYRLWRIVVTVGSRYMEHPDIFVCRSWRCSSLIGWQPMIRLTLNEAVRWFVGFRWPSSDWNILQFTTTKTVKQKMLFKLRPGVSDRVQSWGTAARSLFGFRDPHEGWFNTAKYRADWSLGFRISDLFGPVSDRSDSLIS